MLSDYKSGPHATRALPQQTFSFQCSVRFDSSQRRGPCAVRLEVNILISEQYFSFSSVSAVRRHGVDVHASFSDTRFATRRGHVVACSSLQLRFGFGREALHQVYPQSMQLLLLVMFSRFQLEIHV